MRPLLSVLAMLSTLAGASAQEGTWRKVDLEAHRTWAEIDPRRWPRSLSNTTAITISNTDYGAVAQVEYLAASGVSYLMLLGHEVPVKGRWFIKTQPKSRQICFSYPASAMDFGADLAFETGRCEPVASYRARLFDLCKGDPNKLGGAPSPSQLSVMPVGTIPYCGLIVWPPLVSIRTALFTRP